LKGDRLEIHASVDVKGLRRLIRILKANELLLSDIDAEPQLSDQGTQTNPQ